MRGIIGIIIVIQGAMGALGRTFTDGQGWGILPHWFDLPTPLYIAIAVAGLALIWWEEADKKRRKRTGSGA